MKRKMFAAILALGLVLPEISWAQQARNPEAAQIRPSNPTAAALAQPARQAQTPQTERPQATAAQRSSYKREVHPRRHRSRISKKEWLFMGAVAGTSMGVGAIAAGAHGLAIGAIVGGWGAFAAHKLYHFVR